MSRIIIVIIGLCLLMSCKNTHNNSSKDLVQQAKERAKEVVIQSLVDKDGAELMPPTIEFKSNDVVVLHAKLNAKNSFGGKSQTTIEYILTSTGKERLINLGDGKSVVHAAKITVSDSLYYTPQFDSIVQKNILDLMDWY